nr:HK97 gp10 family phage protein [uncultured Caproiciproducens sp.]
MMIDPKPFIEFTERLKKAQKIADAESKTQLNRITDRHWKRCKDNTATGSSPDSPTLAPAWDRSGVVETSEGVQAEVFNPVEYAAYYEYGHRQTPGRLIFIELHPGESKYGQAAKLVKTGKHAGKWGIWFKLKKPYVKGAFVMTDSEQKAQQELDRAAKRIEDAIRKGIG